MRKKTQVLTIEQREHRIGSRCCPKCFAEGNIIPTLVKVPRPGKFDPKTGMQKISGWYWTCSDFGHTHYYLSPGTDKSPPCETAGVPLPIIFGSSGIPGPKGVIRRKK